MSNFRKTRKRGGFNFINVYKCPRLKSLKKSAISTCKKSFAKQYKFTIVPTLDDGDCFFTSLSIFGKRTQYEPLNKDPLPLRQDLVQSMINNFDELKPFIEGVTNSEKMAEIDKLRKKGIWDEDIGDLVAQHATKAFNININMYDVKEFYNIVGNKYIVDQTRDDEINLITINNVPKSSVDVNVFRVNNGHFELLWPQSMPIKAKGVKQAVSNLGAAMGAMKLQPRRKSKNSNSENEEFKRAIRASLMNSKKPRSRTGSEENYELAFALKESEEAAIAAQKAAKEASEAVAAVAGVAAVRGRRGKPKVAPPKNIYGNSSFF